MSCGERGRPVVEVRAGEAGGVLVVERRLEQRVVAGEVEEGVAGVADDRVAADVHAQRFVGGRRPQERAGRTGGGGGAVAGPLVERDALPPWSSLPTTPVAEVAEVG